MLTLTRHLLKLASLMHVCWHNVKFHGTCIYCHVNILITAVIITVFDVRFASIVNCQVLENNPFVMVSVPSFHVVYMISN